MHHPRQESAYHICCSSCGALAEMRNSSMVDQSHHEQMLYMGHLLRCSLKIRILQHWQHAHAINSDKISHAVLTETNYKPGYGSTSNDNFYHLSFVPSLTVQ